MKKRLMKKLAWALAIAQIFTVNPAICVSAEEADTAETVEVNAPASEEARFEDVLDAEAAEDVASSESEAINDGLVDPEDPNIKASGYFSNGETGPYYALYNDGRMVIEGTGEISFFAGSPEETEFKNALSWAKTVTVEDGITGIPYGLFKEAPVLESVTISDSVTSMGPYLFDGCNKLNSVRLPQGYAEAIPAGLFRECVSLKNVTIPAGVTGINEFAFQGSGITSINIPKNVLYIETAAFETCYNLTAVTGGEGLSEIKNNAFNLCSSLSSFNFGDNIKTIGASAFYECALNFIYVPGTVENLGENCFANNYADVVIIGDGVTSIPVNAFAGCNGFGILYLPSSVTYVGNGAFNTLNSSNVKNKKQPQYEVVTFDDVFFGGSEAEFQKAFEGNTENHSVLDCPNIHYNSKMPTLCTVSFDSAVVSLPSYRVLEGSSIIEPAYPFDPEGKLYYKGCFEDPGYTKEFDFANTKITKDTLIYVKWGEREQVNVSFMKPKDVTAAKPEFETYETIKIWEGQTVSMPDIPAVKAEPGRYEVTGWYHDPDYKDFFYYDTIVYRDTFIYSQWEDVTLQGHCELSSTDGSLVLRYDYTDHVDFDGRKHVWKGGNAKESAKVAKDIRVENLAISYNGVALPIGADGISIKNVVVKRNLNANTDEYGFDDDEEESGNANDTLIVLKLNYNKKNATLKEMFGANKKLKKEINKLCNPKYKKKKYREDGETWYEYEPQFSGETATVAIYPIDISGNSVIYTKAEVASNPALSEKSGILIYSGKTKTTWKTVKEEGESDRYSTKFDIKGLTAQIFVDVNGVPTKKLIKLKAGGWKRKKHVYREDGETDIEYEDIITPKRFDYYIPMGGIKSGDTKVSSVYLCGNFSGTLSDVARSESDYSKDKK